MKSNSELVHGFFGWAGETAKFAQHEHPPSAPDKSGAEISSCNRDKPGPLDDWESRSIRLRGD